MTLFSEYFSAETLAATRARILGYAQAAGLRVTNFVKVSVPYQIVETMTNAANYSSALSSRLVRGYASLDTSTDPGDEDPYDSTNASANPARGMLSEKGAGDYGTERITDGFARGTITITNASGGAIDIAPEAVTFARDTVDPDTGLTPTYRNIADAAVYTNPDGTVTIANGATLDVTIEAEEKGAGSNAGASHVALSTNLGTGVTATNAASIVATVRESAEAYRAKCRSAASILSLGGPQDAYRYIALSAKKADDGSVFFIPPWGDGTTGIGVDSDGAFAVIPDATGTAIGINRVYVSQSSATGTVAVYFASADGDPGATALTDLTALFDAVYWPECTTRSFHRATNVTVTIAGTVKAKAGAGVSAASVATAIDEAITAAFPGYDIGGFDRTAGAGTLYKQEVESLVNGAATSIYKVTLSSPSGDTALALGQVAVPSNSITSSDVTVA